MMIVLDEKARRVPLKTGSADYGRSVRSNVRAYWRGQTDYFGFVASMAATIRRGFTTAWYDGILSCGLRPSDMTPDERLRLESEINSEISYLSKFSAAIAQGSRDNQGKLKPLVDRAAMWILRYNYIYDLARTFACADQKLKWQIGVHIKEHCSDCLALNGKVYRASVWRAHDISPKSHRLQCGGYKCGCAFVETAEPITPGSFPIF